MQREVARDENIGEGWGWTVPSFARTLFCKVLRAFISQAVTSASVLSLTMWEITNLMYEEKIGTLACQDDPQD